MGEAEGCGKCGGRLEERVVDLWVCLGSEQTASPGSIRDECSRLPICREASLFFCSGWVTPVYCSFASYNSNSATGYQTREEQKKCQLPKARAQSGRYQK